MNDDSVYYVILVHRTVTFCHDAFRKRALEAPHVKQMENSFVPDTINSVSSKHKSDGHLVF